MNHNLIRAYVFQFFEVFFLRLEGGRLKDTIHKHLFGNNAQGNELTKFLILNCHLAKKQSIFNLNKISDWIKTSEEVFQTNYLQK